MLKTIVRPIAIVFKSHSNLDTPYILVCVLLTCLLTSYIIHKFCSNWSVCKQRALIVTTLASDLNVVFL